MLIHLVKQSATDIAVALAIKQVRTIAITKQLAEMVARTAAIT